VELSAMDANPEHAQPPSAPIQQWCHLHLMPAMGGKRTFGRTASNCAGHLSAGQQRERRIFPTGGIVHR
jgi:hypothetical protein